MNEIRNIEWAEYGSTDISVITLLVTLSAGALLFSLRREHRIFPLVLAICMIPIAQRIVIATLDFNMIRILVLLGWGALLFRGELKIGRLLPIDLTILIWTSLALIFDVIRLSNLATLIYRIGFNFEFLGIYFFARVTLTSPKEAFNVAIALAVAAIIVGAGTAYECTTGFNPFSVFGGVAPETGTRHGEFRCKGAFSHPILAGTFGATTMPILIGALLWQHKQRWLITIGILSTGVIVVASGSTGPIMAFGVAILFWTLWWARQYTRVIFLSASVLALAIHLIRDQPIWHLIGRVGQLYGSGTGFHRFKLIDAFVENFSEWWLYGTKSTAHWGWGLQDVTNQFVREGVKGGIVTLAAFIIMLASCFYMIAKSTGNHWTNSHATRHEHFWFWGLGVSLTAHMVSFISVTYFGQMYALWAIALALIANTTTFERQSLNPQPKLSEKSFPRHL